MRGRAAFAALALVLLAAFAVLARRQWQKSDDLLRPVVVARNADADALLQPSLGARLQVLLGRPRPAVHERERLIALTFDDGPYPVETPLLVQTLAGLNVPATFFLIGRDAQQFPALAREIAVAGNEIGNHTLTHPDLDRLSDAAVRRELAEGAEALAAVAPDPAEHRLFRPPHGRYTLATIRTAQRAGYDTILWSDDPGDWRTVPADRLAAHVLARATAPEILLLHSGKQATTALLPSLVARFRAAGFRFVTVGTLLHRVPPRHLNRPARVGLSDVPSGAEEPTSAPNGL